MLNEHKAASRSPHAQLQTMLASENALLAPPLIAHRLRACRNTLCGLSESLVMLLLIQQRSELHLLQCLAPRSMTPACRASTYGTLLRIARRNDNHCDGSFCSQSLPKSLFNFSNSSSTSLLRFRTFSSEAARASCTRRIASKRDCSNPSRERWRAIRD
jgi:hypothetical protein